MKMRTEKETVEEVKTEAARSRWSQSVWRAWVSMVEMIFGKDMCLA